jgi:predicted lipid-binding transport protein (Tim44 family)
MDRKHESPPRFTDGPICLIRIQSLIKWTSNPMMKLSRNFFSMSLVYAMALTLFAEFADAKGVSRGKSMGRQSNNVSQRQETPPQTTPAQNTQQQRTAPAANSAQPAAQPPRNRWLGPLAGIAAGLGLAALFSHLGMGAALADAMGSMLIVAAVVMLGLFLWRRMRGNNPQTAAAGGVPLQRARFDDAQFSTQPASQPMESIPAPAYNPQIDANPNWTIPVDFDTAKFLRSAKLFFVRLQAGWDTADLEDIREFTTPEMFAEIKLELNARGAATTTTDVVSIDAELLGIEHIPRDQIASVRFTGTLRSAPDAALETFDEVWNLTKSPINPQGWVLAGIQQVNSSEGQSIQ